MRSLVATMLLALSACATTTSAPSERRVTFDCDQDRDLTVVFEENQARIINTDGSEIVIPQRPSGSGFWYESPTHSLRGQGTEMTYTIGRMAPIQCRQNNTANM